LLQRKRKIRETETSKKKRENEGKKKKKTEKRLSLQSRAPLLVSPLSLPYTDNHTRQNNFYF
jgi:hypothetical protein